MTLVVKHQVQVLTRLLQRHVSHGTAVDMFRLVNQFTLEVFAEIGFGVKMGVLDGDDSGSGKVNGGGLSFENAFDQAQKPVVMRFVKPNWL